MTEVNVPLAVHNLHRPARIASRRDSIVKFLDAARHGIGGFNELNADDAFFLRSEARLRDLEVRIKGTNGVVWDSSLFTSHGLRKKKIMQGGRVGADGVATPQPGDDDRRVGPNRYCLYFLFEVVANGLRFELAITHLMARAFTLHKWRQKLFWRSVDSAADGILETEGVMIGDFNLDPYLDLPGIDNANVEVPPDFGKRRYTKILVWGDHILIGDVRAIDTPSDHHLLVGSARLSTLPINKQFFPDPDKTDIQRRLLPKPGDASVDWRKHGAPVRHPWAERSDSFKRLRKKTWSKIVKWRRAYRSRL